MSSFLSDESAAYAQTAAQRAGADLAQRLAPDRQVGDFLKLDYSEAVVVVHDYLKAKVGGLPLGAFLLASRVNPGSQPDPAKEDTSLILLRVLGPATLPNGTETDMMRFNAAQRSVASERRWDDKEFTDQFTLNLLRYAGLRCRILGTFLLRQDDQSNWQMKFGPDLANFYSGRGMKVYKPDERTLADIVNFVRPQGDERHPASGNRIRLGRVRYAASEREGDDTAQVRVDIDPTDLLARRTALFGMSRTGKSNTTKIIASAVFRLRSLDRGLRVGQLILDPNGEYANDNAQDAGSIRGIAHTTANAAAGDVVSYGLHSHPNDPGRRIIKLNFLGTEPINWDNREAVRLALTPMIEGKEVINDAFKKLNSRYVSAFLGVSFEPPIDWDGDDNRGSRVRFQRLVTAYRTLLAQCRFVPPTVMARARLLGMTSTALRNVLQQTPKYAAAAATFARTQQQPTVSWDQAFRLLGQAVIDKDSGYNHFNQQYQRDHGDGKSWHDEDLTAVLAFMDQRGGIAELQRLSEQHAPNTSTDYADDIVRDLREGRLVVVDQSTGDPDLNKAAAERLMRRIFNRQKDDFIQPKLVDGKIVWPPDVLVYVEEAHNLLPAKTDDLTGIWVRTAKEGSKFRIGLVFATQEPSSIQPNILKNTDNWFVAHLNNVDELRELKKYYDFEDFAQQILTVPQPGFIRMRTLSNPYVVPVQVDRFRAVSQIRSSQGAI